MIKPKLFSLGLLLSSIFAATSIVQSQKLFAKEINYASTKKYSERSILIAKSDTLLQRISELHAKEGKEYEVINLSNQAIAMSPNAALYFYRAYARYIIGDSKNASLDYEMVLSLNPTDVVSLYNLGLIKSRSGNYEEALKLNEKSFRLGFKSLAIYNKGMNKKNFDSALFYG